METFKRRSAEKSVDKPVENPSQLKNQKSYKGWWISLLFFILILFLWEVSAVLKIIPPLFFPAPTIIFSTLVKMMIRGDLAVNLGTTLFRVLLGFLFGGASGMIIGLAMGWSGKMRSVFDPLIAACHPIPKIAILPLIMIIFGIGDTSKIIVVALSALFPMLINSMSGVQQINPVHFEVAENYGAGALKIFKKVVIPGSLPMIMAGARVSLNLALLITIAVELVSANVGLGAMVWLAWETFRIEELYASIAVASFLGIFFNVLIKKITRILIPWRAEIERE
ncbi:MAG: ABC transporter permease [Deltaproteobacteria bacterium]|nr:ABC transporter permease [Deltaproteobacteria bacterium]